MNPPSTIHTSALRLTVHSPSNGACMNNGSYEEVREASNTTSRRHVHDCLMHAISSGAIGISGQVQKHHHTTLSFCSLLFFFLRVGRGWMAEAQAQALHPLSRL